jgi:predicted ester cyclase
MRSGVGELRGFAERYTAEWCSHDPVSVAAFYTRSGLLSINANAPAEGRKAIAASAGAFMTAFPDLQVVIDDIVTQVDRAVYYWTLSGTNTGPCGARHRVRISGFEVWTIGADGLIAESRGHFDGADYRRRLQHGAQEID